MIYHLQVGNKNFDPTGDDLVKVIEEFKKPVPAFTVPVKISMFATRFSGERLSLHIKGWTPTDPELETLKQQFMDAQQYCNGDVVVATRCGVTVETVPIFIEHHENKEL